MKIDLLQEELTELKELKEQNDLLILSLGEIMLQKIKLDQTEQALKNEVNILAKREQEISEKLIAKYGNISVDVENGVATKIS